MSGKRRKLLLIILAIFVGIVMISLMSINSIIRSKKPDIETKISEALGAKVTIGELHVSLLPSARIVASDIAIGDTSEKDNSASLSKLVLDFKLVSLLKKELNV